MTAFELCELANIAASEAAKFLGITFSMKERDFYTKMYIELYFSM